MSGHWIKVGDTRINAAAQTSGNVWEVAEAVSRLYDVARFIPDCEQELDEFFPVFCQCHGSHR